MQRSTTVDHWFGCCKHQELAACEHMNGSKSSRGSQKLEEANLMMIRFYSPRGLNSTISQVLSRHYNLNCLVPMSTTVFS
jgi:hypothetical protein